MKLVAVTENGKTKVLPMAEPNWEQLWGTGPYVGQREINPPPPKQSEIGVAKEVPVFVRVDSGAVPPSLALFITVLFALVGAFGGQLLAHFKSTQREQEERYIDAASATFRAASSVNGAMGAYVFRYSHMGASRETKEARHDAFEALAQATDKFEGAAISFDLRTDGPADDVLAALDEAQATLESFLEICREHHDPMKHGQTLYELHQDFTAKMNAAIFTSRKLKFGRQPRKRTVEFERTGLAPRQPQETPAEMLDLSRATTGQPEL